MARRPPWKCLRCGSKSRYPDFCSWGCRRGAERDRRARRQRAGQLDLFGSEPESELPPVAREGGLGMLGQALQDLPAGEANGAPAGLDRGMG